MLTREQIVLDLKLAPKPRPFGFLRPAICIEIRRPHFCPSVELAGWYVRQPSKLSVDEELEPVTTFQLDNQSCHLSDTINFCGLISFSSKMTS
jgi:hypothetical protein